LAGLPACHYLQINEEAQAEHVVTPAKSNLTDWESYTPTTQGFGTPTISQAKWRRVGDSAQILATFTTGTPTAVEAQFSLPSGLTVENGLSQQSVGIGQRSNANGLSSLIATGGDSFLNFNNYQGAGANPENGSSVVGSGEVFSFVVTVPIEGWSSDATLLAAVPKPTFKNEEQFIGYWFGEKLYERSFDRTGAANSNTTTAVATIDANLIPISLNGMALTSSGNWETMESGLHGSSSCSYTTFHYDESNGNINYRPCGDNTSRQRFTIRYTR